MAISSDQRAFLTRSLQNAIAKHYGEDVPNIKLYTKRKRATFIEQLKKKLNAKLWYSKVSDATAVLGTKKSAETRVKENYRIKQEEARAERDKRVAQVEADYQETLRKLTLKYEPELQRKREERRDAQEELNATRRASYFAAIESEDDGRYISGGDDFDRGITSRVDEYIENRLEDDELGAKVKVRIEQENLVGDVAYIEKNVESMRVAILRFVTQGDLPPITVKAWNIIDGKDTL